MSEGGFQVDAKTQHSVVQCLEIIGEAANNLSTKTRDEMPSIPWHDVIAQRHVAIHHYNKLDMTRIWRTVTNDLPKLIETLERSGQ